MILERRRILGGFAVFALVVLRLVVGWHFFGEGAKKLQYDSEDKRFHLAFSADKELLDKAKGPLAPWYFAFVPAEHDWRKLLATPRENNKPTPEQIADRSKWQHEYNDRRVAAAKKGEVAPVEFPPAAPYRDWATKIADDWRAIAEKVKTNVPGLSDDQKKQIDAAVQARLETLAAYLAEEEENIATYRHDLLRLKNWRESPEGENVPFSAQRIATKTAETGTQLKGWTKEVDALETEYFNDLEKVLTPDQRKQANTLGALSEAITDPNQARLDKLNIVVTAVTIGVGACLLLGLLTRLASLVGAVFLLGVILSQPFWITDSVPTINQCIECAALLVLAGTGAGRWFGLDAIAYALFRRRQTVDVV